PTAYLPGVPPKIMSLANEDDWERFETAIISARQQADALVVSMHWGDHTRPYVITDFERTTANRLRKLGVDLILGHHQHYIRGIDLSASPVFFGLGHIIFDLPRYGDELRMQGANWLHLDESELERRFGRYAPFPRRSGFAFDDLARWTFVAIVEFFAGSVPRCGIIPIYIGPHGTPGPIKKDCGRWEEFLSVMKQCLRDGYVTCDICD